MSLQKKENRVYEKPGFQIHPLNLDITRTISFSVHGQHSFGLPKDNRYVNLMVRFTPIIIIQDFDADLLGIPKQNIGRVIKL